MTYQSDPFGPPQPVLAAETAAGYRGETWPKPIRPTRSVTRPT